MQLFQNYISFFLLVHESALMDYFVAMLQATSPMQGGENIAYEHMTATSVLFLKPCIMKLSVKHRLPVQLEPNSMIMHV